MSYSASDITAFVVRFQPDVEFIVILLFFAVFTARRYTSTVCRRRVSLCVSVCLSAPPVI